MYWHIGLHKTATTWLQDKIFKVHPEVFVVNNTKKPETTPLLNMIIASNSYLYSKEAAAREFNLLQFNECQKKVISAERLSGHPASGHYDQKTIAQRIAELDSDAKIILSIRRQDTLIPSIYKQLLKAGLIATLQNLLESKSWKLRGFDLDAYHFNKIVEFYFSLFGSQNVHICYFEELQTSPLTYLDKMFHFIGIKNSIVEETYRTLINPSIDDATQKQQLAINYFRKSEFSYELLPQSLLDISQLLPLKDKVTDALPETLITEGISEYLKIYFHESNSDLRSLLPDLPESYFLLEGSVV